MTVRSIAKSPDVTLYNENHPSVFDKFRLISLDKIGEVAATTPSKIALFKPIVNTPEIFEIGALYPKAKSILAIRHYVPVQQSYVSEFGDRGEDVLRKMVRRETFDSTISILEKEFSGFRFEAREFGDIFLLSWIHRTLLMLEFFESNRSHCVLSLYENFLREPRESLQEICRLLDIDFSESMAASVRQRTFYHPPFNAHPMLRSYAEKLYFKAVRLNHNEDDFIEKLSKLIPNIYSAPIEKSQRYSWRTLRNRIGIGTKSK